MPGNHGQGECASWGIQEVALCDDQCEIVSLGAVFRETMDGIRRFRGSEHFDSPIVA